MENTANLDRMSADLHLIAAPFRLVADFIKVTLFVLAAPMLCALVILHYAIGNWDPFYSYLHAIQGCSPLLMPFAVLGAILMLVLHMLLIVANDLCGMLDILLRVPLLGVLLFALVSTIWFVVIRGCYLLKDGKKSVGGVSSTIFGFVFAFVAGMYVFQYSEGMPPASLFALTTLASASPTLLYLLYRALKPTVR